MFGGVCILSDELVKRRNRVGIGEPLPGASHNPFYWEGGEVERCSIQLRKCVVSTFGWFCQKESDLP